MKRISAFICLLIVSISVFAQHRDSETLLERLIWDDKMLNIMVDTRVDYQLDFEKDKLDDAFFHGQTLKVWAVGDIIPGIHYRVRHRLTKPQTPLREGFSSATDHAWISFDVGSHWTFRVGKQSIQLGSFEFDYNTADVYLSSMVNSDFDGYKLGLNTAYHFSGQTINLQIVNSDSPQFADEEYKNKSIAIVTLWEGSLFNSAVRTRWGYGAFQHAKSKFYHWLTLGTQINIAKFTTEVDYYLGPRQMDYGYMVDDEDLGYRAVRDQSLSVNLKYNFGKWKPFIKGTWNQRHDKEYNSNAYESSGLQAVVEWYPFTNKYIKDLRFHAAYAYLSTDFQGEYDQLIDKHTHTLLVGTRWLFKVK